MSSYYFQDYPKKKKIQKKRMKNKFIEINYKFLF